MGKARTPKPPLMPTLNETAKANSERSEPVKVCRHCQSIGSHYCSSEQRQISEDESGDFLMSAAIGMATNSAIIGGLLGGDFVGGMVGDMFNGGGLDD